MKSVAIKILTLVLLLGSTAPAQSNRVTSVTQDVSRCKILKGDSYVDYKTADHHLDLQVDKSACSKADGKIKILLSMDNVLFRGSMNALTPMFGLYNKENNSFERFTEATAETAKKTEAKMKAEFEATPGADEWKKLDSGWRMIGKTFTAKMVIKEYPCKPTKPSDIAGEIWVSPSSIVKSEEKKPFENTFVIHWDVKNLYAEQPDLKLKISHSPALCQTYQYILPTEITKKMQNNLYHPVDYTYCYSPKDGDIFELGKNMNDIYSHFSRPPKDTADANKLYNEYINSKGIYIDKEAKDEK